jgi:hypothetical protein
MSDAGLRQLRIEYAGVLPFANPDVRCAVGLVVAVVGVVLLFFPSRLMGWSLFLAMFGIGCFLSGLEQSNRQRRIDSEMQRAIRGWEDLRTDLASAAAEGRGTVRVLLDRGYREYEVRKWILSQLRTVGSDDR